MAATASPKHTVGSKPITQKVVLEKLVEATNQARGKNDYKPAVLDVLPSETALATVNRDFEVDDFLDVTIPSLEVALHAQLDRYLHDSRINTVMAKWKAITDLVLDPIRDEDRSQVSLIPARKREVYDDYKKAGFDATETEAYRMLVRQRYGTYGGNPFLFCVTDIELGPGPDDLKLAGGLSKLGAAAHMAILPACSPKFFKVEKWTDLPESLRELKAIYKTKDNDDFRTLKEQDDARFLPVSMLRLANRVPFGQGVEAEGMESYVEGISSADDLSMVTSNFGVARLISASIGRHGWPSAIIGNFGGLIGGLYSYDYTVGGETNSTCPTEIPIDDHIEMFFEDCGFLVPVHCQNSNKAALFAAPTIQSALRGDDEGQADASAGAKLPNVLIQCMFAHLMKVMLRAMIGSGMKKQAIENFLQQWANAFVSTDEDATEAHKAKYPFSRITVKVETVKGKSGVLQARVELVPRFRVAAVSTKLLIKSDDIPPAKKEG